MFIALLPSNGPDNQNLAAGRLAGQAFEGGEEAAGLGGDTGTAEGLPPGATGGSTAAALANTKASAAAKAAAQEYLAGGGDTSHCKDGKRFKIFYATQTDPNCVAKWPKGADNGGATYLGVTATTIKAIFFEAEPNAAVNAVLQSQGLAATDEEIRAMDAASQKFIAEHDELYGRKIEWERVRGNCATSPPTVDECLAAAREVIK